MWQIPSRSHEKPSPHSGARWHFGAHVPRTHWSVLWHSLCDAHESPIPASPPGHPARDTNNSAESERDHIGIGW